MIDPTLTRRRFLESAALLALAGALPAGCAVAPRTGAQASLPQRSIAAHATSTPRSACTRVPSAAARSE